jgi:glycosyltransferase involved in cell wall biosynthesis
MHGVTAEMTAHAGAERSLRIVHVSHGYPPAVGGSETVMRELSRRLAGEHGHAVTVVTTTARSTAAFRIPGTPTLPPGEEWLDGVRVRRHAASPRLAPHLRQVQERAFRFRLPGNGVLRTLYDGPLAPGMLADACRLPADVLAATAFPLLHMQFAVIAARARRKPVVLFGALHPRDRWGYDRGLIRFAIRHSDAYCAYTSYEQRYVASLGVPAERIHVIPPGIDPGSLERGDGATVRGKLGISPEDLVVGFFGQLAAHKGVDDLVTAMRLVWAEHPSVHLVVAGARTHETAAIERSLRDLPDQHRDRAHLVLDVDDVRKAAMLAAFDVFASPSGYESFGLTFVEAWAARLPVVGCREGAVPSLVRDGVDGLLVPYRDPPRLARALAQLLGDGALRRTLGAAGQARASTSYTWASSAARLDALYRDLAAANGTQAERA